MGDFVSPLVQIPATLLTELEHLRPLLDAGTVVHALGRSIVERLNRDQPFDSKHRTVTYFVFAKSFKTFQAAWNLCLLGCGADALALCGSLYENLVDLLYIGKAPNRRAFRFIQFEQVGKYRQCQKILKRKRLPKGMRKTWRERYNRLDPEVKHLLKSFPDERQGWSQKSLWKRAKAVRLDLEYDDLYHILCGFKHTLPAAATGFMLEHAEGADVIVGPSIKGVFDAGLHSATYMLRLIDAIQRVYALGIDAEVERAFAGLSDVADQVFAAHPEMCD